LFFNRRQETNRLIRESEEKFRTITESALDAIVMMDNNGRIVLWNPAAERLFGWKNSEVMGKVLHELITTKPEHRASKNLNVFEQTGESPVLNKTLELPVSTKDGSILTIELTVARTKIEGLWYVIGIMRNMTDRKKAAEQLQQRTDELERMNLVITKEKEKASQAVMDLRKFVQASDNANDLIVITDPEGIILYGNKAVQRITGYTLPEALGKKAGVLWRKPMDQAFYEKLWDTIKNQKRNFTGIIQNRRKNGEVYDASVSISPVLDDRGSIQYFASTERDVTDQQRSIENAERLASIVRNTEDAIIGKTLDGIITSWNIGSEKLYGYSEKEVLGKRIDIVVPQDRMGELRSMMAKITKGEVVEHLQTLRKRKDGSLVEVSITTSPIKDANGRITGASTIARDITKERQIDKAKTEFVSLASHQLRTPLSAINWYAEMLLAGDAGKLKKEQKSFLEEIYHSNQRMVSLVNSLLNVSRLELGTFMVDPEKVDIREIADSVIGELQPQIKKKAQSFTKKFGKGLPVMMLDKKLIRMVIQNLLTNAVKYTREKGKISFTVEQGKKNLLITVADTGMGIPKSQQPQIFKKMFRADNVREADTEGTGLGLYIVKAIITNAGGKVWFESEENKGTTFYVTIPMSGMLKKTGSKTLS
jgi:PAS domain S-box-containing protein